MKAKVLVLFSFVFLFSLLVLRVSYRYQPGAYQYTEKEMQRRLLKLKYKLWRKKGIDILVTHSPARHLHDGHDLPHRGFETFMEILNKYHPKYFIHGHVHMNYGNYPRFSKYEDTIVINAFERFVIEVPLPEKDERKR